MTERTPGRRTVLTGMVGTVAAMGLGMAGAAARGSGKMVFRLISRSYDVHRYGYKALDGDRLKVMSIKQPDDDGVIISQIHSGWPVDPKYMPTKFLRQGPKRFMPDVVWPFNVPTVNDAVKSIIEQFEPGVHQFLPADILWEDGSLAGKRYLLMVCRRLDTIHRGLSTMEFREKPGRWIARRGDRVVYDLERIANRHLWYDKYHTTIGPLASSALVDTLQAADISGITFVPCEAVGLHPTTFDDRTVP